MKKRVLFVLLFALTAAIGISIASEGKILVSKEASMIYFTLGKHYFEIDDYENAISYFKKAISSNSDFAEAYHNLGIAHYSKGDIENSLEYLTKAVEINKGYAKAYYSIALIYYENGDYSDAIANLLNVIQLEPNNENAHFDISVIYAGRFMGKESAKTIHPDDLEDLKNALSHYLNVVEIDSNFPHALSNAKIVEGVLMDYEQKFQGKN